MKPGQSGVARIISATRYSMQGIGACWRHEAAFRQEVLLGIVLLPLSFFVARSAGQWITLVAPLFLILMVELLNSGLESVVDRIGDEHHELAGRAKDMGSAAVFFALCLLSLSWGAVIWQNTMVESAQQTAPPTLESSETGNAAKQKAAECEVTPPSREVACTMQYDPVCGCDGKTYGNACVAGASGVPQFTPGACEATLEPR